MVPRPTPTAVGVLGEGGREEAVGPVLGELARVGEHDRHARVAHLELGDQLAQPAGPHARLPYERAVALLDHHRSAGQRGQFA